MLGLAVTRQMKVPQLTSRVDEKLHSIKGGGACQLREKVLAEAAETWVIVADYRKNSKTLGTNVRPSLHFYITCAPPLGCAPRLASAIRALPINLRRRQKVRS